MKLDSYSTLTLESLKGSLVSTKTKEGIKITYRIYDFYIDLDPDFDDEKDEMIGLELTNIGVSLVPILSDGVLATEEMEGRHWNDLKDYTIHLPGGFPNEISNKIK